MGETKESLLNIVNSSGFLFQMRVADELRKSKWKWCHWKIVAEEHRWTDEKSGEEGFIDIVLQAGVNRLVVECKRVRDGNWIFLGNNYDNYEKTKSRVLLTHKLGDKRDLIYWDDLNLSPESRESKFCVVRGTGENSKPMLENIAGKLLKSLEALALEEFRIESGNPNELRFYFPIIITNANLWYCTFDENNIDLSIGELSLDKCELQSVPYLRFRKNLSTNRPLSKSLNMLSELNNEYDRTVFIINVNDLYKPLDNWEVR